MEKYNHNFITLIKIFNHKPYMFLNFLNKHNAISDNFKTKLSNIILKDKPHFTDIDKMIDYYSHILDEKDAKTKDKVADWNNKLYIAITEQRFEDAAKIRDYMNKRKFKIFI